MTGERRVILVWISAIGAAGLLISQLRIDTDMSAFLPRSTSPAQRVLVDQLREGVVSRLLLLAVEGVRADRSIVLSKDLAARLRGDPALQSVENGEDFGFAQDRGFLWTHRYILSDQAEPDRFSSERLRAALQGDLRDLGSTAGFLLKQTLAADPTNEMLHLIDQQRGGGDGPVRRQGVWTSPDGGRALLLVRLRAAGPDIDGAQQAIGAIRSAFGQVSGADPAARLIVSGPPLFAVEARDRIKSDATRLSALASLLVAASLLAAYRSLSVLLLAFVPVVSGALAGVAAVGLAFKSVHGITLGFGATLIGEAVDYAVYLFTQTAPDSPVHSTLHRIWPTLRLGVLTSICGFSAMLLSSFDGFAQLGLFTIVGLGVAVCVTRWVLPAMLPARFAGVRQSASLLRVAALLTHGRRFRPLVIGLTLVAAVSLSFGHTAFWAGELSSLSPVPPEQQRLDQSLRRDMRAPDAGMLIVVHKSDQEAALAAAERVAAALIPAVQEGKLVGFDSPARYLPSQAMQRVRQAALPDDARLAGALDAALDGLPFQPGIFAPFIADVGTARSAALIDRADLDGTALSLKLDSLLLRRADGWMATLPLRGVTDRAVVARAVAGEPDAVLVDLRAESDRLLGVFMQEGLSLASLGAGAICLLLIVSLRSARRVAAVIAPLAAAVVVTLALLRLGGHALSIFTLFGLLLVVAIGSNYCLFLDRGLGDPADTPRVVASLLLANACTVMGFGVLALSRTPVLHDLGLPVALGAFLSLVFAVIAMSPPHRALV